MKALLKPGYGTALMLKGGKGLKIALFAKE